MKKLLLLSLATSILCNLTPQAQAGLKRQSCPLAHVAWTSSHPASGVDAEPSSGVHARKPASSTDVQDDAGLFRSFAERTMNNPG